MKAALTELRPGGLHMKPVIKTIKTEAGPAAWGKVTAGDPTGLRMTVRERFNKMTGESHCL